MIRFRSILEAIETNGAERSDWYDPGEIPAAGKEEKDPAPELKPSIEDENYGKEIEL